MRPIPKFRAWIPTIKRWADWITMDEEAYFRCGIWDKSNYIRQDYSLVGDLVQFTGLLDKNGKEIYEEDIVQFKNEWMSEPILLGRILWDDLRLCFSVSESMGEAYLGAVLSDSMDNGICEGENLEVIGNIYENPELIKK
jgi:uncharacterized phage protein (TIGR01671 family)